ncbi:MAG TPA: hypothetical protein EYQ07_01675 [Candidatus Poseidoniales archaeon]|nr:MAG: hypothetical protein CXT64_06590 [Euryarchaeota archaeon]HIE81237.1 hypothetical protein [Candidatus Poseidoniales archaeon]
MNLESLLNLILALLILSAVAVLLLRELIKRWRIGLRLAAGDESLLTDDSVSMKTVTDGPLGSSIVNQVPAVLIVDESSEIN